MTARAALVLGVALAMVAAAASAQTTAPPQDPRIERKATRPVKILVPDPHAFLEELRNDSDEARKSTRRGRVAAPRPAVVRPSERRFEVAPPPVANEEPRAVLRDATPRSRPIPRPLDTEERDQRIREGRDAMAQKKGLIDGQ